MFDFHMHSSISFDSEEPAAIMLEAARKKGLREICFTDHCDIPDYPSNDENLIDLSTYNAAYSHLDSKELRVRMGFEYGLGKNNSEHLKGMISRFNPDFVIGSIHYVEDGDPYKPEYWQGISQREAFEAYFRYGIECLKVHSDFDALGHLTYICKCPDNPEKKPLPLLDFLNYTDEIMKLLISKGIGMEVNTSGINAIGEFLPSRDFFLRFKELGGEIVTVGSDAHTAARVGEGCGKAIEMLGSIFGYVCTFNARKPIFHKL